MKVVRSFAALFVLKASAAKDDTAPGTNDAQQSVTDKRLR